MGCWGITAFESDVGLDAVEFIREGIPSDGKMELGEIIGEMQREECRVYDVADGLAHSGPMALTEVIIKLIDQDFSDLDCYVDSDGEQKRFGAITSFVATKESIQWLRDYISDTLKFAKEKDGFSQNRGGWLKEKDWQDWQDHMVTLVSRLNALLAFPEDRIELSKLQGQKKDPVIEQTF